MESGIYVLYNLYTGKKYVGSSRNLAHRKASHFSGLRNGNHENYKVQKEYNEWGEDGFRWEVLERCKVEDLMSREQFWLDSIRPELNILLVADNHSCTKTDKWLEGRKRQAEKMRGRKQSNEEKEKRRASLLAYWAIPENRKKLTKTNIQKNHLSEINLGERNPNWGKVRSVESREKARISLSKIIYIFLSPEGEEVTFYGGLKYGCSLVGLPYGAARNLYRGLTDSHFGWKFLRKETAPTSK